MWMDETHNDSECAKSPVVKLPVQLFCFDPDLSSRSETAYLNLVREGIVEPRHVGDVSELEAVLCASLGNMVVSLTATASNQGDVLNLAKRIVRLNTSQHRHIQLIVILNESIRSLVFIDSLESLGTRIVWRNETIAVETFIRLAAWRFSKRPLHPVPCFYLHYPDSDTLEIYLLGRIKRTQLAYGEKLGTLFEMMSLGRRWVTRRQIAEELDISRSSVKVYLDRLRDEYDAKRSESGVDVAGKFVFCSEIHNGVWMHRFRGQILVID